MRRTSSGSCTSGSGSSTSSVLIEFCHGETSGGRPDSLSIAATPLGSAATRAGAAELRLPKMRESRRPSPAAPPRLVATGIEMSHITTKAAKAWKIAPTAESRRCVLRAFMRSRTLPPNEDPMSCPMPTKSTRTPTNSSKRNDG